MKSRETKQVVSTILGVLLFSLALFAQGTFGRILGTVTDQTGGVLAGATVSIIDKDRGLARTLTTDAAGEYNAPTLIPGTYTVRVEAKGFKRLDRENVLIEVGKEVRVDLTPQPGEQAQTVTVTEAIPLVDTATSTLGGALSNAEINDLPLNGRNYQYLLALRPGVMIQPGGSPWSQSTNNVRPDETAWMLDGVINVEFWDARPVGNAPSPLTDAATIIPIDAIQEFNTEENPKAEFGWKPGAVVNVGIRSGTNTLHGSAYAFGRDVDWDARNAFNPGLSPNGTCVNNPAVPAVCDKLPTQLEQFGATVGGRIKKDKLFFFAGYEGMRSTVGNVFVFSIPETGGQKTPDPQHSMVDAINALQAAKMTPSPVSLKLAGCTTGPVACTGGLFQNASANTTNYDATFPNTNVSDNGIGKMDYRINNKHMINGMLWTGDYKANGFDHPIVNELYTSEFLIRTWSTVENWIWTPSSSLVNEARFGYNRYSSSVIGADNGILPDGSGGLCTATGCGGKGFPINTGVKKVGGLPDIRITGFGGGLGNPSSRRPGANAPNPYSDYQDSVSYLRGKHALKFGGEFAHIEADQDTQNFRGRIDFKGKKTPGLTDCGGKSCPLEDFFAGNPFQALVNVGDGVRRMTWRKTAGFVQDDWRVKPRLMVNLGLRYEYTSPIKEVNGLWGNFDPALGLVQQGQPSVGDTVWKPDYKNFSPRVGFAWDVTGKGTTVIRGGASMMYSSFVAATFMFNVPAGSHAGGDVGAVPTKACTTVVAPGGTCPQTLGGTIDFGQAKIPGSALTWNGIVYPQGAGINCAGVASCSVSSVDPNLRTPYIVNYNFGVQHTITSNLSLEVGYVGNHGDNLIGNLEVNQCAPNPDGNCVRPYSVATAGHPAFPYLAYINRITNYARSNYNSLQTTLTKRLSHGLNFTAGYTYGHGLDNGSLNRGGGNPQNSRNTNAEYASSDFDIRHRLTVTASYAIPGKKGFGQLLEGWKLNTIVSLQASQPWGVDDTGSDFPTGGSGNGDLADRWNFYGNPSDFKSGSSSLPYCADASTCSVTSGISTIQTFFSPSASKAMWAQCTAVAPDPSTLAQGGCFVSGKSVMTPPKNGTYGTSGRNIFRDSGFKNVDFSLFKDFKFKERFGAQFRVEFFNVFNHPNIANPNGSSNTSQLGWDPSAPGTFGGGGGTPDVAAGNPIIGSGSARDIQLGFKLTF
jgi:carboxypeptidase family protein